MGVIPAGFAKLDATSPFHDLVGPLYVRSSAAETSVGLLVADKHQNRRGVVHGGMICTLTDFALGYTASIVTGTPRKLVTTSLACDFAGNARPGDWIEARVEVYRPGNRVAFASCFVWRIDAGGASERIARASATFQILRPEE